MLNNSCNILNTALQASPTPGPWTGTGPRPVRNRAAQQEVSGGQASEASFAAPHGSHYRLNYGSHYCLNHPTTPIFHETSSWCQKGWGPLLYWKYKTEWLSGCRMVVSVRVVCPCGPVAAAAQHDKRESYRLSLARERAKFEIQSMVSTECILLLPHCKVEKS